MSDAWNRADKMIDALDRAIPPEELEALRPYVGQRGIKELHGGNVYQLEDATDRVCSYNNTRKDEAEIIAWIEQAKLLV